MAYVYVAEKRREVLVEKSVTKTIPDQVGLCNWRWLAAAPYWYYESDVELIGAKLAPVKYPNGVAVYDKNLIAPWTDIVDDIDITENELSDDEVRVIATKRGIISAEAP